MKSGIPFKELIWYFLRRMGGGTGTGGTPFVAQVAQDMKALTVGVVTLPFNFEAKRRRKSLVEGKTN
ncbi:MAG: hypothetical protein CM1200mP28_02940 [Deltaproteobacteria bacterium]|nr:MAG: hypothetical protein CM1200mP28_02940 [Deltaproteobacteria bacterium]